MLIYQITNTVNAKIYIGKTVGTLENRWKQHLKWAKSQRSSMLIHRAINKYGQEKFSKEVLVKANSLEELNHLERLFISQKCSLAPNGYNLALGGEGGAVPGHVVSLETGKKISASKRGIPMSDEQKQKLSVIMSGRILSDAHRLAISVGSQRPHTLEAKQRMSRLKKEFWSRQPVRTECSRGHQYTVLNTRLDAKGRKVCRECARIAARKKRGQLA